MQQHAHHSLFSPVPSVTSSPRGQQRPLQAHAGPPQAHTGSFALPHYQPSHLHPHHLQGPAAAAAFESYSQSLATLSRLSQRLQPHARLPGPPSSLNVDPYLAAAAAAAVHAGESGSPPLCKRQSSVSSPPPVNDSAAPLVKLQSPTHDSTRRRNPYDFCEPDLSPDEKFHIRYKTTEDVRESHQHEHRHHHHQHHIQQQQQQQRKPVVGLMVGDKCHDENHNAFNDKYRSAVQLRDRPEVSTTHAQTPVPLTSPHERRQSSSGDAANRDVVAALSAAGNGNDVISESPEALSSGRRSTVANYRSGCPRRQRGARRQRADFSLGSMIQLSDGRVKRIEDMRTEDFVIDSSSSSMGLAAAGVTSSQQLVLVSSRVVHIRLNHDTCTAVLGFVVDNNLHSPVSVEAQLDQPFFVHGSGWSSCDPARTHSRYHLTCRQLSVGDICISLTTATDAGTDAETRHCYHLPTCAASVVNSRESREWTSSAAVLLNERQQAGGRDDRCSGSAAASWMRSICRKRRWSAPPDCSTAATPTTTTHHHGNASSSSSSQMYSHNVVSK